MADPLSVAASVVGLLAAGTKLASLLSKTASLIDAPASIQAVLTAMQEISSALKYLQRFLNGLMNVPAGRQQYILVEHLEGTLTGCVTTYDELGLFIDELKITPSDMGILDRFKWARKEKDVANIVQRLQSHKTSLNLMLTILQCNTNSEVQQSVIRLCSLLEQEVSRNDDLSLRLSRVERNRFDGATSIIPGSIYSEEDNAAIRPEGAFNDATEESGAMGVFTFAFEGILISSRVYSRVNLLRGDSHSETSITSSYRRNAAFAIFSKQSIAEISNLSVYSLPISIGELSNKSWYMGVLASSRWPRGSGTRQMVRIIVRGLSGGTDFLSVPDDTTGLKLKQILEDRTPGYGYDCSVLVLGSTQIEDMQTLWEQGVNGNIALVALSEDRWDKKTNRMRLRHFEAY